MSSCQRQKLLSNKFILYAWIQKHEWLDICEAKYFIISIFRKERRDARGSSEIIKIQSFKISWWKVKSSLPHTKISIISRSKWIVSRKKYQRTRGWKLKNTLSWKESDSRKQILDNYLRIKIQSYLLAICQWNMTTKKTISSEVSWQFTFVI